MKTVMISLWYIKWHYGKAIYSLSKVWKNFLFFVYGFFSIKLLFKNFFDPWKKMSDNYPKSFNLKKYFYTLTTNLIVRIMGMIMRTILILVGLISCLLLIIFYPVVIISWLLLPFIIICLISSGLWLIIK